MNDDFQTDFKQLNVFKLCKGLDQQTERLEGKTHNLFSIFTI